MEKMKLSFDTIKKIHDQLIFARDMYKTDEEKSQVDELIDIIMFGEEFMASDDKGSKQKYEV